MYTVFNKPLINLDPHIDITELLSLKSKVSAFVARNLHLANPIKLKQSNFYNTELKGVIDYELEFKSNPENFEDPELIQDLIDNDRFSRYIVYERDVLHGCKSLYLRYFLGSYTTKHLASSCLKHPEDAEFDFFYQWLDKQNIFTEYGRVQLFINDPNAETPLHRDYPDEYLPTVADSADQFVWFTLDRRKKMCVFDEATGEKFYTDGYSSWFNTKAYHGTEPCPYDSYSIRVDGTFTDEFINKIKLGAG